MGRSSRWTAHSQVARVWPGETLRLVPVTTADEQPSAQETDDPRSVPSPSSADSLLTTHAAIADGDGGSLLSRTRGAIPAPVPWFRRVAAVVKAGAGTSSPEALELLGNRGPGSRGRRPCRRHVRPTSRSAVPSAVERARAEWRVTDYQERLDAAILRPRLRRCVTIAVVSPKGGVGKTTVTALVGMLLSHIRRDRIVAVDTNPDYGSLGRVLTPDQQLFVDDLLVRMAQPDLTLTELDSRLGRATHGLMVLPAPTDPERMAALDEPGTGPWSPGSRTTWE